MGNKKDFIEGLKSGIPIGLGYLSVSFAFGIMCIESGLYWWQALIISMTTLTSAGQLAGLGIMVLPHMYIEMLINQLTINVRYSFMSISLSQKTDSKFKGIFKWLLAFFITDEIFGVAVSKKSVSRSFFFGLGLAPYFGWAIGTLIGALLGQVFPDVVMNALSIAMYGMFIAIIVPFTPLGSFIGLVGLEIKFIVMIFIVSFLYCLVALIAKRFYVKIYKEWI